MFVENASDKTERMRKLRDRFKQGVFERIPDAELNGEASDRLPNISNISFRFIEGKDLLINLDTQGIAVSTGSACSLEPSPLIRALGRSDELARRAIRFSRFNTEKDINRVLEVLPNAVETLRHLNPKRSTP